MTCQANLLVNAAIGDFSIGRLGVVVIDELVSDAVSAKLCACRDLTYA